jgi:lactam utilization protein B
LSGPNQPPLARTNAVGLGLPRRAGSPARKSARMVEAAVTAQVLRMVLDGEVVSRHGKVIKHKVDSLCVHGDEPTAVKVALAVRAALEKARVRIVALPEMPLS